MARDIMMDEREKQIDELAKTLYMGGAEPCGRKIPCKKCSVYSDTAGIYCACYIKAERLYDAGYRKQEQGEWRTVDENREHKVVECTNCMEQFYFKKKGQLNIDRMPRCPKCGAKMKVKEQ